MMDDYTKGNLPGCVGSIDVVRSNWVNCAAGDSVRAKGKEMFPTLAIESVAIQTAGVGSSLV